MFQQLPVAPGLSAAFRTLDPHAPSSNSTLTRTAAATPPRGSAALPASSTTAPAPRAPGVATAFASPGAGHIRFTDHFAPASKRTSYSNLKLTMSTLVSGMIADPAGEALGPRHADHDADYAPPPPPWSPPGSDHASLTRPGSSMSHSSTSYFYPPPAADARVQREEILRMLANRIMFSRFYKIFYSVMTLAALYNIYLSFVEQCPSTFFLTLECIVNMALMAEVGIRFLATRRQFFQSKANLLDVFLVAFCLVLLVMLMHDASTCDVSDDHRSQRREALVDSILLIVRNALQMARIVHMVRKNQTQLTNRVVSIDFTSLEEGQHQHPLLFDAEDQENGLGFASDTAIPPIQPFNPK
ncbi:hypothetical protein, variant [Allomyces macrogynus ATCC 38327]|uniref:Ion transport domain-containing protein n=1 Tax=Allomyces macrogynus (strain ATCC 38327) TaxID=578462 RepID=A0A0L0S0N3_ALLM3|nr:hypothetical protein, variant [Allomyces macrogynus ATCC 38327]|eukprot:KNE55904.1 hypothetical protein, variant [Allomyces macrogynus ATCC 38327]